MARLLRADDLKSYKLYRLVQGTEQGCKVVSTHLFIHGRGTRGLVLPTNSRASGNAGTARMLFSCLLQKAALFKIDSPQKGVANV